MAPIQGEVEFEFQGDGQGGGEFIACGKVVNVILGLVSRGDLDEAAKLYASCSGNVGDELLREATSGAASKQLVASLAEMLFKARDFGRAAQCAERTGSPEVAARFLESNYQFDRAADFYLKAGNLAKAAELFERSLAFDKAATLYVKMRDYPRAAENLEKAGRFHQAGQIYMHMSRWEKAVEVFQRVERSAEEFVQSTDLLGQILERTGNRDAAMQRYVEVVRTRPIDAPSVEIHHRLARLCMERGLDPQAERLVTGILSFDPQHAGAMEIAGRMKGGRGGEQRTTIAASVPIRQSIPEPAAVGPAGGQVPGGGGPRPLDLGLGESAGPATEKDAVVGLDRDFEFLRMVPLFKDLSLEELRYVQSMCEKVVTPAGSRLIEQGRPGEALHVVARGRASVTVRIQEGREKEVGEIGPGSHAGEMALLDDAPTSASVTAATEVCSFRLTRERFRALIEGNERVELRIYRVVIGTVLARLREANARLAARQDPAAPGPPACPGCGAAYPEGARHCPECGASIDV